MAKIEKDSLGTKIMNWFFEEDNAVDNSDAEVIEINIWQAVLIVIITILFLVWIFYSRTENFHPENQNYRSPNEYMEDNIEKNYFKKHRNIENGDFSQGLCHWNTSDGGVVFEKSKSEATLETNDFHSAPYALKIESIAAANRYYYVKTKKDKIINNPYGFINDSDNWLGVLPDSNIAAGFWYKGDIVKLAIQCLNSSGSWLTLASKTGWKTDQWENLELKAITPVNARAIALEITLNRAAGDPLPLILIDDVYLKLNNNE